MNTISKDFLEAAMFILESEPDHKNVALSFVQAVWMKEFHGKDYSQELLSALASLKADALLFLVSKGVDLGDLKL